MFDIGWSELLLIAIVLIVVVGPKDLPPMLRAFGKMTARFRRAAGEVRAQFDQALREGELDDLRHSIGEVQKLNPAHSLRDAMSPLRQIGLDLKADLQKATRVETPSVASTNSLSELDAPVSSVPPVDTQTQSTSLPPTGVSVDGDKTKRIRKPRSTTTATKANPSVVKTTKAKSSPRKSKAAKNDIAIAPAVVKKDEA